VHALAAVTKHRGVLKEQRPIVKILYVKAVLVKYRESVPVFSLTEKPYQELGVLWRKIELEDGLLDQFLNGLSWVCLKAAGYPLHGPA